MKKRNNHTRMGMLVLAALLLLVVPNINTKASEESNSATGENMTQVTIEEADVVMQLPTGCYILDQNIEEDNPYLQKVGGDKEKIQQYYKEAGIVLNAIAEDDSYEIVVTMNENNKVGYIYNMQSLTQEQIKEFADTIQTTYTSYGYTVDGYELCETQSASYVVFQFGQIYEDQKVQCKQYYTIRDSRIYNITLRSYIGEVTEEMGDMIAQVIDSIAFSKDEKEITYENEEKGVRFTLSHGWKRVVENKDNQYVQAQYMHSTELGESIQFFCMDIWGNMDSLHQLTNTREELTMQGELTSADKKKFRAYVSGFFDDYNSVSFQKINGTWYLTSDTPMKVESSNINGAYLQKNIVTIQKGILYAYQYGYYESANLHEADFIELTECTTYESPKLLMDDEQYYKNIASMLYKATVAVMVIVIVFVFIIYLYYRETNEKKL